MGAIRLWFAAPFCDSRPTGYVQTPHVRRPLFLSRLIHGKCVNTTMVSVAQPHAWRPLFLISSAMHFDAKCVPLLTKEVDYLGALRAGNHHTLGDDVPKFRAVPF